MTYSDEPAAQCSGEPIDIVACSPLPAFRTWVKLRSLIAPLKRLVSLFPYNVRDLRAPHTHTHKPGNSGYMTLRAACTTCHLCDIRVEKLHNETSRWHHHHSVACATT